MVPISDNDAVIVVEEIIGGGKNWLSNPRPARHLSRETSPRPARFRLPYLFQLPVVPRFSVDVDVVAPMKAPSLVAKVDDTGAAKSINITTDGFTADEADTHIASIQDQLGSLDNFEINGQTLNADEVDIMPQRGSYR